MLKKISIGLSAIGGIIGVLFGLLLGFYHFVVNLAASYRGHYGGEYCYYLAGVSLFAIFGWLIERKGSLIAGSLICLITGVFHVILAIISEREIYIFRFFPTLMKYIYLYVPSFLIIAGGVLGVLAFIRHRRDVELREKKMKLIIGSTPEGKLEWIKTQYFDLHRNIQDIADDLGESMMTVKKYLNEIENQDKSEN